MRYIVILLICAFCIIFGTSKANALGKKVQLVDALMHSLNRLKMEIGYGANNLNTAARNISKNFLPEFWQAIADNLESGADAAQAWNEAKSVISKDLDPKVSDTLDVFFNSLGKSDMVSQCNMIDQSLDLLALEKGDLAEQFKTKGKLYNMLGIMSALVIAIALV